MSLKQAICSEARRLGFSLVGVTTPEAPPHFEAYLRWLQAGRHGEMAYLGREQAVQRRADPRQILPECRSVLVLGIRYPAPPAIPPFPVEEKQSSSAGGEESISGLGVSLAAYAKGDDYHDVLPSRLCQLVEFIEAQLGAPVPNRWYTDTGPLLERDLAQRAGLGWIGKNTCLINPGQGSYFLLAELLLGLELQPDQPFTSDHCGKCTRCIDACPTGCILPDRTLDARRCISYLTIELKGAIPVDLRPRLGEWAFGCDICQQVCPWNVRFASQAYDPAFTPRPGFSELDATRELALTPQDFNHKFRGSPVRRAKRRGYLRNTAVVLGNSRSQQALPALSRALSDPEPLVRQHAAWGLSQIANPEAYHALQAALSEESDADVRREIQSALGWSGAS